jgi:hypothetical protein
MRLTPEQKAKELIEGFLNTEHCHKKHIPNNRYCDCTYMGRFQAKQCALICVDEIISVLEGFAWTPTYDYWQKVRQEIEKL